jgi:hypothetical protein
MATKKELLAQEVAKAVGAGKTVAMETVDFNDPNRPKTCLEVDFPILAVNQVAIIQGNACRQRCMCSFIYRRLLHEAQRTGLYPPCVGMVDTILFDIRARVRGNTACHQSGGSTVRTFRMCIAVAKWHHHRERRLFLAVDGQREPTSSAGRGVSTKLTIASNGCQGNPR